jgi:sugar O-acyltransferase (sialic acid O-acetyltransferase NeuD family)
MHASIIGYGELGKQYVSFLNETYHSNFFWFDDVANDNKVPDAFAFNSYGKDEFKDTDFYVSLGYKHLEAKHRILQELQLINRKLPSFIHASCFVNKTARIDDAAFVYPMCNIDKDVSIGLGCLINNSVTISHDNIIGNCCYISPGVVTSGNVSVGDYTFIGSGSVISNNVTIGRNVRIGIGSVITQDVPDGASVIGNPMKIVGKPLTIL